MYIKLDHSVIGLLCCPLCKSDLQEEKSLFQCRSCGLVFPQQKVQVARDSYEPVYDFRIHHPSYIMPPSNKQWLDVQNEYEKYHNDLADRDSAEEYLNEIDSVREIYTEEYSITGRVLDVGGHQGRLRHYLSSSVSLYVSIDPCMNVFERMDRQPNLLKSYPRLCEPCNFLVAQAEYLPFRSRSFDWVHMRSVVDHFADPFLAFLEAFRVCDTAGKLMVGLAIMEKICPNQQSCSPSCPAEERRKHQDRSLSSIVLKLRNEGVRRVMGAGMRRLLRLDGIVPELEAARSASEDDHIHRLTYAQLMDLHKKTNWRIVKEHWQKPPFDFCIYSCAEAKDLSLRG